jgi:hypothetical protein
VIFTKDKHWYLRFENLRIISTFMANSCSITVLRQLKGEIVFLIFCARMTGYSHTKAQILISILNHIQKWTKIDHSHNYMKLLIKCKHSYEYLWPLIIEWFLRCGTKYISNQEKIDNIIKMETCASEVTVKKNKKTTHRMEKYFYIHISHVEFVSKICFETLTTLC